MWFRLGPAGDLRSVPPVEFDQKVDVDTDDAVAEARSLTGRRAQDRMGQERRAWTLPWPLLTPTQVAELVAMKRGRLGGGLWLIDPLEPNVAPAAVASAGTDGKSPTGWYAESGSRTWARSTVPAPTGVNNVGGIFWSRSTIADTLSVARDVTEQRVPLLPEGGPVSFRSWLRLTTTSQVAVSPGIDTFTADGTRTSSFAPTVNLPGDGSWVEVTRTITPPAGAVTWGPVWTIAAGQPACTVHIPAVAMGYGATPPAYSTGGGAARVFIRSLKQTYDDDRYITAQLVVAES